MKNILLIIPVCFFLAVALFVSVLFVTDKAYESLHDEKETAEVVQESEKTPETQSPAVEVKIEEEIKPSALMTVQNNTASSNNTPIEKTEQEQLYRMLDFDRRLILNVGEQDEGLCSIFTLAYARAILDGSFKVDPYDYYDGGAVWSAAGFADIAEDAPLSVVLQRAYDEIEAGRPVIFYVDGIYAYTPGQQPASRKAYEHYALLIGHKLDADYDHLKPSDFYGADPTSGYKSDDDTYVPWIVLTDDAPKTYNGEYALYAEYASDKHLKLCDAAADTVRWDAKSDGPVYPQYREKEKE